MIQSGGFLGKLLGSLIKTGLTLIKNVITPLAKNLLIPLGITAAAVDAGIHKKILGSGRHTTLIISIKDMEDLIKVVKSLEDSGLFLNGVTESVKNEVKEQPGGFLSMLLGTLGAGLLGNLLREKRATATSQGRVVNKKGKGIHRVGEGIIRADEEYNKINFQCRLIL